MPRRDRPSRPGLGVLLVAVALGLAPGARAQVARARTPFLELHVGVQAPDSDKDVAQVPEASGGGVSLRALDRTDPVLAARAGVAWKRLSVSGLATRYATQRARGRLERTSLVAEAGWSLHDGRRMALLVHGGLGAVRVRATDAQEWESRSLAMLQAGIALRIDLGSRVYLRPELRGHAYSGSEDNPDWEATLGLGFRLGRQAERSK